jgi:hypothetical protein
MTAWWSRRRCALLVAIPLLASVAVLSESKAALAAPGGLQLPWPTATSHNISGYTYGCLGHRGQDMY